ncbi:hypothetical protein [Rhizobium hidalgonense]|uniref:hypothetical protein n=1 Tax=Rhizobium hidalgonense TaxID=1538159 RepID=UPI0010548B99|nr:hypothetical protein [Rhizobium hidalgonense]
MAAVFAAAITIRTMEKTDRQSERRHRELIEFQLRPERLRLTRALHPQIDDLKNVAADLEDFQYLEDRIPSGFDVNRRWLSGVADRYLDTFFKLEAILKRRQFEEGINLFDGITTRYLDELVENVSHTRNQLACHVVFDKQYVADPAHNQHYPVNFEEAFPRDQRKLEAAIELLPRLIESLEVVERKYGMKAS